MSQNRSLMFFIPSRPLTLTLAAVGCLWLTGCVGPMACGPMDGGPGVRGPISFGCGGCGDCSSCGELYVDPWINEPANTYDPCDQCGNYNGQSCGKCRGIFGGIASLWGYRLDGACHGNCSSGCSSCQGSVPAVTSCDTGICGHCDSCSSGAVYTTGEPTLSTVPIVQESVSEQVIEKPVAQRQTKRIFRSRAASARTAPHHH